MLGRDFKHAVDAENPRLIKEPQVWKKCQLSKIFILVIGGNRCNYIPLESPNVLLMGLVSTSSYCYDELKLCQHLVSLSCCRSVTIILF